MNIEYCYNAFVKKRFPLPSAEEVDNAEKLAAIQFPDSFRDYLSNFNGGYFLDPTIRIPFNDLPDDRLDVLYGINATDSGSELCQPSNLLLLEENEPRIVLPIG